jgi:hypothetical protein
MNGGGFVVDAGKACLVSVCVWAFNLALKSFNRGLFCGFELCFPELAALLFALAFLVALALGLGAGLPFLLAGLAFLVECRLE